jgi:hypothetical protein
MDINLFGLTSIMSLEEFNRDYAQIIQIGIMVVGILTFIILTLQLRGNNKWSRVKVSLTLLYSTCLKERDDKMKKELANLGIVVPDCKTLDSEQIIMINKNKNAHDAVIDYLNYIERICAGINYKAYNNKLLYSFYSYKFIVAYDLFRNIIEGCRTDRCDKEFFVDIETVTDKWRKRTKRIKKIEQMKSKISKYHLRSK